jgi:predicted alpha/beta superfamily hydrolase
VGVDNHSTYRLDEYSPWINPEYGGGQGDEYVAFLVETLKPYVDANYRTLPDRDHTGIMGSSMGGLISLYGAVEYQDVFGRAGVFSPSFWFSPECYSHVTETGRKEEVKIYMIGGELEGDYFVQSMHNMKDTLVAAGFEEENLFMEIHPLGDHTERYWREEFPDAYTWLYSEGP